MTKPKIDLDDKPRCVECGQPCDCKHTIQAHYCSICEAKVLYGEDCGETSPIQPLDPVPVKIDLVDLIRQAAPQVYGSDERLLLQQWLDRNTEPQQIVEVNILSLFNQENLQ